MNYLSCGHELTNYFFSRDSTELFSQQDKKEQQGHASPATSHLLTLSDTVAVVGAPGQARGLNNQVLNSDDVSELWIVPVLPGQPYYSHV